MSGIRITRKVFVVLSLTVQCTFSFSQTFQRTFGNTGNETGTCIQNTLDGNYIVAGITSSFSNGYEDAYLFKMDPAGNVLWSKAYGTTYKDRAYYVSTCSDGGFILTGTSTVFSNGNYTDTYLIRTDSNGGLQWTKSVGGTNDDNGWYVKETDDGGFVCVGSSKSFSGGNYDGMVIKTDAAGNVQWKKLYGGTNTDNFYGMSKTTDGGFIVTGITSTNTFGSSDIWLVKLDSGGDTLWTRQYGKVTEDAGNSVIQTTDGGYLIAGDIHIAPAAGNHNSCLLKTDAMGNMQWAKTYGSSPGSEIAWDLRQTTDGGYLMLGSSGTYGKGSGDILAVKTDNSGNMQWARAYGSTGFDDFWYSAVTSDGGTMIVGSTPAAGTKKVYVLRLDAMGHTECDTTTVDPYVNIPVMQTRSGTGIYTAGGVSTPATFTYTGTTTGTDPCTLISVNEIENNFAATIFPNPSNGTMWLSVHNFVAGEMELKIYDVTGSCVHSQIIKQNDNKINVRIAKGLYFYKITSSWEPFKSGRIVIE